MSPEQLCHLLEYIKENNSWGDKMYDINNIRNRRAIKYVGVCFDSRDGLAWRITFQTITGCEDKIFRVENQESLNEIYKWLDEPLKDGE